MKKRLPVVVTLILLLAGLLAYTQRERWTGKLTSSNEAATPEDVIWQMADAAREGDAQAYLNCFSGALRQNLEKTAEEMGEAKFKEYLQKLHNEVTGIAVSDLEQPDPQSAMLRVEFVYQGKSEAQKHHFKFQDGQWKIERADSGESKSLLIPYGTGVKD